MKKKERFDYIVTKILKHLPCYIGKVPRRLSLSMKSSKENTNEEDNKEEKKPEVRKKQQLLPINHDGAY